MRRHAPLFVALALLVGSAVAFGVAERLKVEKSPVTGTVVDKVFSPSCRCPQRRALISFRLRRADRLKLSLLDDEGREIRTLVDGERAARGPHEFFWNGRDDHGRPVPEGRYRPKVELGRADRTIVLPNPISVDVTRPRITSAKVVLTSPGGFSPDGDGFGDVARVRYRLSEPGRAILYVKGLRRVTSRRTRPAGAIEWLGRGARPGSYRLVVRAQDLAGNVSRPVSAGRIDVRYVVLAERDVQARPNERVRIAVAADAPTQKWILRRGSSLVERGTAKGNVTFRAPERPGRYVLVVTAAGHSARATVVVRRPR